MADYTLFIPDISGFTRFVKTTEINHSKHIIEELITLIMDRVGARFQVAEIEGDAVFFYSDRIYTAEEVIELSKEVFVAFHGHLLNYQHNRICNCGACSTAIDLNLKFVVHSGEVSLAQYGNRGVKPFGDAVIAIHRLLKNDVKSDEYVLFTDKIKAEESLPVDGDGIRKEEDLGDIPYRFLTISSWKKDVLYDVKEDPSETIDIKVSRSRNIDLEAEALHQFISDFKFRKMWNIDSDEIIYDQNTINQAGTQHYCIIKGKNLYFETIKTDFEDGFAYGEILKNPKPFKYAEIKFLITENGKKSSKVNMIMSVSFKWQLQKLLSPLFKSELTKRVNNTLDTIVKVVQDPTLDLA